MKRLMNKPAPSTVLTMVVITMVMAQSLSAFERRPELSITSDSRKALNMLKTKGLFFALS